MRVLVLGAGGPAGVNFIRSLHMGGSRPHIVALDENPYHLEWPQAAVRVVAPPPGEELVALVNELCEREQIELVHAQPDPLVRWLGANRDRIVGRTYLPDQGVIETCQDKERSVAAWNRAGLRSPAIRFDPAKGNDPLPAAAMAFGYPYWLRATTGAGGRASTLVENRDQGFGWLRYWRGRDETIRFIAEEYLPGDNLAFSSVWREGTLVASCARQRLEYIYPGMAPSGITGTSSVTRSVNDHALNVAATRAILAVDPEPHGVYCVDLKRDRLGVPRPTEINPGRFFTICDFAPALWANLPEQYVRLATGRRPLDLPKFDATPPGWLWIRHIDCPAVLVREDEVMGQVAPAERRAAA